MKIAYLAPTPTADHRFSPACARERLASNAPHSLTNSTNHSLITDAFQATHQVESLTG